MVIAVGSLAALLAVSREDLENGDPKETLLLRLDRHTVVTQWAFLQWPLKVQLKMGFDLHTYVFNPTY